MSQSFTSMDARTQPLTKQDIREIDADYLRLTLHSGNPDARTRALMEEELERRETTRIINKDTHTVTIDTMTGMYHSKPKDVPVYPEPEGDPSY